MLLPVINLAIVLHCFIFGIFFLRKKDGRTYVWLGTALIMLSVMTLPYSLRPTRWIYQFPYTTDLEWAAGFFFAPLYLFFIREQSGDKVKNNWLNACLLLPGVVALAYFGKFFWMNSTEQIEYLDLVTNTYIRDYEIGDAIFYPYIQGYFIYIIFYLEKKRKKAEQSKQKNLTWLRNFTLLMLSFGFFGLIVFFLKLPQIYIDLIPVTTAILYFGIIYKYINSTKEIVRVREVEVIREVETVKIVETIIAPPAETKSRYANSNLTDELVHQMNFALNEVMVTDKPFLDPDLHLNQLASKINFTSHQLSQLLNQYHEKNFSDYINQYRVEEAKSKLMEQSSLKMEVLGMECGFKTKTTFNASFKKHTGMTPSEYKKAILEKTCADL